MNKEKLYVWACDFSSYTGEGNLGRLFVKKKLNNLYDTKIICPQNIKLLKISILKHKYILPLVGIYFCWKFFFFKKKRCYLNYLPLWNILIFALLPPNTVLGPITGGSRYKDKFNTNFVIRKYLFPILYKISSILLKFRNYKIIFATNLLKKHLNKSLLNKSEFTFFTKGIKKNINFRSKKPIDFIVYYKKHKNKKDLYPVEFLKKLIMFNFKVYVVGDKMNLNGIKNLGYLNKIKLKDILSKTKFSISSGENIASFFSIDCVNSNVKIISNLKVKNLNKRLENNLVFLNTDKPIQKSKIINLIENY